jgi:single-strand DNA-binding protein
VWRQAAENAAETLEKGMRAIVTGRLRQRTYEARDGGNRTVCELEVDEAGPSLRNATAKVAKVTRPGANPGPGKSVLDSDPWTAGGPGGYPGEPPF